ncbi:MAG: hypothetical protein JSW07_10915, partial [bacterium]
WGYVKEPLTKLVKVTKETVNFAVTFGAAILSNNPGAAMQALEDYGNFVWQGVVSFAQSAAEFYVKMNAIFVTLALCALKVLLEYISAIGEAIVEGLNWFVNFLIGVVKLVFDKVIEPIVSEIENFVLELGLTIAECIANPEDCSLENLAELIFGLMFVGTISLCINILAGAALIAEQISMPWTASSGLVLDILIGAIAGLIVGAFFATLIPISEENGEGTLLRDLLPNGYDVVFPGLLSLSEFVLILGLIHCKKQAQFKSIKDIMALQHALFLALLSMVLISGRALIKYSLGEILSTEYGEPEGNIIASVALVAIDILSLWLALNSIKVLKGAGGALARWYRLTNSITRYAIQPISIALSMISLIEDIFNMLMYISG